MIDLPPADLLALVPGAGPGSRMERLGRTAERGPWRVTSAAGDFVLHRRRGDAERGAAVHAGLELQRLAAEHGIAARVVAIDPASASHVVEYLPGRAWARADLESAPTPARLGVVLARLHALPLPRTVMRRVSHPLEAIEGYARRAVGAARALERARELSSRVRSGTRPPALVHFDLHAENIIDDGQSLRLIDWEYARVADPLWDLAGLAAMHPAAVLPRASAWLRASGLEGSATPLELAAAAGVCEAMNAIWALSAGREH